MRLAFFADGTVNGFYRATGPASVLAGLGHTVVALAMDRKNALAGVLRDVDVLHIHRYADEYTATRPTAWPRASMALVRRATGGLT